MTTITRGFFLFLFFAFGCGGSDPAVNDPFKVSPADFLSASPYTSLVIELHYVEGYEPSTGAINNLFTFLQLRLNKPGGVYVTRKAIPASGKSSLSITDIRNIEIANRTQKTNGTFVTAYIFFADAEYADNGSSSKVLGIAYGSSSIAIFEKTIQSFSGGISQPSISNLETTVINHEFGHIFGLVNNGTPLKSQHQDVANGKHCTDTDCLMYYTAETSDVIANLLGGTVPQLTGSCLDDLAANGGK